MVVMIAFLVSMLQISICLVYKLSADGLSKCQVFRNMTAIVFENGYPKNYQAGNRRLLRHHSVVISDAFTGHNFIVCGRRGCGVELCITAHGLYIGFLLVASVVMYRIYMKLIFRQDLMEAYMEE